MKNAIVKFYGEELITAKDDQGTEYVAMKPLCENLGMDWHPQRKRMLRDDVLKSTVVIMDSVGKDNKNRQMVFLPIEYLNGWLFGVDTSRLKDEAVKEKIIVYKKECFKVLHNYWSNKGQSTDDRFTKLETKFDKFIEEQSKSMNELAKSINNMATAIATNNNTTNVNMGKPFFSSKQRFK